MAMRSRSFPQMAVWSTAVRGPKKKKGPAKADAPESSDIVNIFKDRPDAEIHASDRYPPWLMRMLEESYSPDDVMMQMYRGERVPTGAEQWSLVKSFRRTYLNDQNYYLKEDLIYESDDDFGEDTGMNEEEEVQVTAAATTDAAAGGEKKAEGAEGGAGGAAAATPAGGDAKK